MSGGTLYLDTALFTCDLGFNIQGSPARTCGPDGNWDSVQPTCEISGKEKEILKYYRLGSVDHAHCKSTNMFIIRFIKRENRKAF